MKGRTIAVVSPIAFVLPPRAGAAELEAAGNPAFVPARFAGGLDAAETCGMEYEAPQRYNEDALPSKCATVAGISRVKVGADGKPVPATYVELRGDPEWFTLKVPEGLWPRNHQADISRASGMTAPRG